MEGPLDNDSLQELKAFFVHFRVFSFFFFFFFFFVFFFFFFFFFFFVSCLVLVLFESHVRAQVSIL